MKALYLVNPGQTEIRQIDPPHPQKGELLLKVEMVGFCGGDLNGFRGAFPLQEIPMILGHEVGAVIEEVDYDVPDHFSPGMKVTLSPYQNCGECFSCKHNRPNACVDNRTMGVRRPGAMTRYITVPWQDVYISEQLDTKELALVEPLSVGFHAVRRGQVNSNDTVVILGCGMVGMGAISSAVNQGAKVIAVDIDDKKVEIAQKAGAHHSMNSANTDLHSELSDLTDNNGPDVIIEAVGSPITFRAAVEEVAFTGRVVYIGYAKAPVQYDTKLIVQKELDIFGSRNCLGEFTQVIEFLGKGDFPVNDVITRIVSLDDAGQALADWNDNPDKFTKIMVNIDESVS